ncbi:hypothetical protein ACLBQX_13795, partial [Klebsiella pneumoniae]
MSKSLQKPTILNVETVARSRLFNVESVDLEFSNGVRRVYERMRPSTREAVMIVPIVDDHIILQPLVGKSANHTIAQRAAR